MLLYDVLVCISVTKKVKRFSVRVATGSVRCLEHSSLQANVRGWSSFKMRQPECPSWTIHGIQIGQGRDKRDRARTRAVHGGGEDRGTLNVGGQRGRASSRATVQVPQPAFSLLKALGLIS